MLRRLLQSSLARAAGTYGLANVLRQALPVLLAPIMTRYLSPADYGVTAMFTVLVGTFAPFVGMSVHSAIARKYYDREEIDFAAYVWNCLLVVAITTVLGGLVVVAFGDLIARLSEFPREWLWAVIVVTAGQVLFMSQLAVLQVEKRAATYARAQVSRSFFIVGITLGLVVGLDYDWRGSVLGQVIVVGTSGVLAIVMFAREKRLRMRVEPDYIRHAFSYGGPLIMHSLSAVAIQVIDRVFVTRYAGLAETGIYSIGYQFGAAIGLLEDSFNRAWQPWFFERLKGDQQSDKRSIVRFTYIYFAAILLLALLLGIAAPWILTILVSPKFQGAYIHVLWVALGYAFNGMYKMVVGYLFYTERTGVLGWLTFAGAAVNVLLNLLLVPRFGAIGAAFATTGGFFVHFVLTFIAAVRVYPMPWRDFAEARGG